MYATQTILAAGMMPVPRWKLLNLLFTRPRRALDAMLTSGADENDVADLEAGRLIRARWRPHAGPEGGQPFPFAEEFFGYNVETRRRILESVTLMLGQAGARWFDTDPYNQALWAVDRWGRRPVMSNIIRRCLLDLDAVLGCADAGHLVIVDEPTSAVIQPARANWIRRALTAGDTRLHLSLTTSGRNILHPE